MHAEIHTPPAAQVRHLSDADDPRWAGVITLAPFGAMPWAEGARHDIHVVAGSVTEALPAHDAEYGTGTFISRDRRSTLTGGAQGATLFVYHDSAAIGGGSVTLAPADQQWQPGRVDGMTVTLLSDHHHRLILVRWRPGTRAHMHQHPWGEEIYVLEGELQDQRGRYPAGAWQRLRADSGHAPFAEVDTLIMLRNGHLRD